MAPRGIPPPRPILLVDDDPDDVESTLRALREAHIVNPVDVVADGDRALHYLKARRTHLGRHEIPVLILVNLKQSEVTGFQALNQLDADGTLQDLPVIAVTSSKPQEDRIGSSRLGVKSFLRRPVDFRKFRELVPSLGIHWLLLDGNPVRR